MKILLINVCLRPDTDKKIYPVGLGYVASAIWRAGFNLEIVDLDIHRYSEQGIEEILRKKDFDIVGFGCIASGYKIIKNLCSMIKKINREVTIIVGNSVATSIPHILLSKTQADIAVIGEGDITVVELLELLRERRSLYQINGIYFKNGDQIIHTKPQTAISNLDDLPLPNWNLFEIRNYISESKNYVSEPFPMTKDEIKAFPVNTARGCIYKCTFCYHAFRDYKYRFRSPFSVVREIKELKRLYGINYINFWDELTFFAKKQAEEFVDELLKEELGIFWTASCRADLFKNEEDIKLAKKFKRSGCVGMGYSLESANREIIQAMNKRIKKEDFMIQKKILDEAGIVSWTSLVFGYPQETEETIMETMDFCYENDIYPSVGYLLPQPGTPMYQYAIHNGFIHDEEEYLLSMGDRQDLRINLTRIPNERFEYLIKEYLLRIRDKLNLSIPEGQLIKTGHYKGKLVS